MAFFELLKVVPGLFMPIIGNSPEPLIGGGGLGNYRKHYPRGSAPCFSPGLGIIITTAPSGGSTPSFVRGKAQDGTI
jgi:hypothetical protein